MFSSNTNQISDNVIYSDDVFASNVYNGNNGSTQVINNLDLATKGGAVMIIPRSIPVDKTIWNRELDSTPGAGDRYLRLTSNSLVSSNAGSVVLNTNGFTVTYSALAPELLNQSTNTYASYSFVKSKRFFDIVTYTGNGAVRTLSHNLSCIPGMILIKSVSGGTGQNWICYHRGIGNTSYFVFNGSSLVTSSTTAWNSTSPTASEFTIGTLSQINASGTNYVAYLFAHDDSEDGVIFCGSGPINNPINLPWKPQFFLHKGTNTNTNVLDNDRKTMGFIFPSVTTGSANADFYHLTGVSGTEPNVETITRSTVAVTNTTSFNFTYTFSGVTNIVYVAIRESNKPILSSSNVFNAFTYTGNANTLRLLNTGIKTDLILLRRNSTLSYSGFYLGCRDWGTISAHTASGSFNSTNSSIVQVRSVNAASVAASFAAENGIYINNGSTEDINLAADLYTGLAFREAKGFFRSLPVTTGSTGFYFHDLGSIPELILFKTHNTGSAIFVYFGDPGKYMILNNPVAAGTSLNIFNNTSPTINSFHIGPSGLLDNVSLTAFLFSSVPGVSKISKYTGNGSSLNIDCGFTNGIRFVLIKAITASGSWHVFTTANGINPGTEQSLTLDSGQTVAADSIDYLINGFTVNQNATTNINQTDVEYLYFAIS